MEINGVTVTSSIDSIQKQIVIKVGEIPIYLRSKQIGEEVDEKKFIIDKYLNVFEFLIKQGFTSDEISKIPIKNKTEEVLNNILKNQEGIKNLLFSLKSDGKRGSKENKLINLMIWNKRSFFSIFEDGHKINSEKLKDLIYKTSRGFEQVLNANILCADEEIIKRKAFKPIFEKEGVEIDSNILDKKIIITYKGNTIILKESHIGKIDIAKSIIIQQYFSAFKFLIDQGFVAQNICSMLVDVGTKMEYILKSILDNTENIKELLTYLKPVNSSSNIYKVFANLVYHNKKNFFEIFKNSKIDREKLGKLVYRASDGSYKIALNIGIICTDEEIIKRKAFKPIFEKEGVEIDSNILDKKIIITYKGNTIILKESHIGKIDIAKSIIIQQYFSAFKFLIDQGFVAQNISSMLTEARNKIAGILKGILDNKECFTELLSRINVDARLLGATSNKKTFVSNLIRSNKIFFSIFVNGTIDFDKFGKLLFNSKKSSKKVSDLNAIVPQEQKAFKPIFEKEGVEIDSNILDKKIIITYKGNTIILKESHIGKIDIAKSIIIQQYFSAFKFLIDQGFVAQNICSMLNSAKNKTEGILKGILYNKKNIKELLPYFSPIGKSSNMYTIFTNLIYNNKSEIFKIFENGNINREKLEKLKYSTSKGEETVLSASILCTDEEIIKKKAFKPIFEKEGVEIDSNILDKKIIITYKGNKIILKERHLGKIDIVKSIIIQQYFLAFKFLIDQGFVAQNICSMLTDAGSRTEWTLKKIIQHQKKISLLEIPKNIISVLIRYQKASFFPILDEKGINKKKINTLVQNRYSRPTSIDDHMLHDIQGRGLFFSLSKVLGLKDNISARRLAILSLEENKDLLKKGLLRLSLGDHFSSINKDYLDVEVDSDMTSSKYLSYIATANSSFIDIHIILESIARHRNICIIVEKDGRELIFGNQDSEQKVGLAYDKGSFSVIEKKERLKDVTFREEFVPAIDDSRRISITFTPQGIERVMSKYVKQYGIEEPVIVVKSNEEYERVLQKAKENGDDVTAIIYCSCYDDGSLMHATPIFLFKDDKGDILEHPLEDPAYFIAYEEEFLPQSLLSSEKKVDKYLRDCLEKKQKANYFFLRQIRKDKLEELGLEDIQDVNLVTDSTLEEVIDGFHRSFDESDNVEHASLRAKLIQFATPSFSSFNYSFYSSFNSQKDYFSCSLFTINFVKNLLRNKELLSSLKDLRLGVLEGHEGYYKHLLPLSLDSFRQSRDLLDDRSDYRKSYKYDLEVEELKEKNKLYWIKKNGKLYNAKAWFKSWKLYRDFLGYELPFSDDSATGKVFRKIEDRIQNYKIKLSQTGRRKGGKRKVVHSYDDEGELLEHHDGFLFDDGIPPARRRCGGDEEEEGLYDGSGRALASSFEKKTKKVTKKERFFSGKVFSEEKSLHNYEITSGASSLKKILQTLFTEQGLLSFSTGDKSDIEVIKNISEKLDVCIILYEQIQDKFLCFGNIDSDNKYYLHRNKSQLYQTMIPKIELELSDDLGSELDTDIDDMDAIISEREDIVGKKTITFLGMEITCQDVEGDGACFYHSYGLILNNCSQGQEHSAYSIKSDLKKYLRRLQDKDNIVSFAKKIENDPSQDDDYYHNSGIGIIINILSNSLLEENEADRYIREHNNESKAIGDVLAKFIPLIDSQVVYGGIALNKLLFPMYNVKIAFIDGEKSQYYPTEGTPEGIMYGTGSHFMVVAGDVGKVNSGLIKAREENRQKAEECAGGRVGASQNGYVAAATGAVLASSSMQTIPG